MVQGSSTTVVSADAVLVALKGLYSEDGPPVEDADLIMNGMPTALLKALQVQSSERARDFDKDILEGLAKAVFKLGNGPRDAGTMFKYFQRGGGYYIDVGTSQLIADGKIKMARAHLVTEILSRGVKLSDGSEIEADEIVFATGYQSMRSQTRQIFGSEVADRLPDI